jgi:hypothetical protein
MNKRILPVFATVLIVTFTALGQDPEQLRKVKEFQERGERITKAYAAISRASPSLRSLNESGKRREMIIEAGKTGGPELTSHLKVLAYDKDPFSKLVPRSLIGTDAYLAHIALAKLGDPDVLPEVFAELESPDFLAQDAATAKLGAIGGKEAYRKLFQLLDDTTPRPSTARDEITLPRSAHAMGALSQLFDDTPKSGDRAAWKAWAAKNKHLIE